mmetsp:Transcript_37382/g.149164  ORF Transcript_37382/g.149164 Transcript_37382/m.149164 type:complete len:97 (+) Transcript_37382:4028-4318(+)
MLSKVDRVPSVFRKWVSTGFKWEVFESRHLGVIIESAWIEWVESCFDALELREMRTMSITTVFADGPEERTGWVFWNSFGYYALQLHSTTVLTSFT